MSNKHILTWTGIFSFNPRTQALFVHFVAAFWQFDGLKPEK